MNTAGVQIHLKSAIGVNELTQSKHSQFYNKFINFELC